jgi:hypothetical protein
MMAKSGCQIRWPTIIPGTASAIEGPRPRGLTRRFFPGQTISNGCASAARARAQRLGAFRIEPLRRRLVKTHVLVSITARFAQSFHSSATKKLGCLSAVCRCQASLRGRLYVSFSHLYRSPASNLRRHRLANGQWTRATAQVDPGSPPAARSTLARLGPDLRERRVAAGETRSALQLIQ